MVILASRREGVVLSSAEDLGVLHRKGHEMNQLSSWDFYVVSCVTFRHEEPRKMYTSIMNMWICLQARRMNVLRVYTLPGQGPISQLSPAFLGVLSILRESDVRGADLRHFGERVA